MKATWYRFWIGVTNFWDWLCLFIRALHDFVNACFRLGWEALVNIFTIEEDND